MDGMDWKTPQNGQRLFASVHSFWRHGCMLEYPSTRLQDFTLQEIGGENWSIMKQRCLTFRDFAYRLQCSFKLHLENILFLQQRFRNRSTLQSLKCVQRSLSLQPELVRTSHNLQKDLVPLTIKVSKQPGMVDRSDLPPSNPHSQPFAGEFVTTPCTTDTTLFNTMHQTSFEGRFATSVKHSESQDNRHTDAGSDCPSKFSAVCSYLFEVRP